MITRKLIRIASFLTACLLGAASAISLAEVDVQVRGDDGRVSVRKISAIIVDLDPKSREITLEGSLGNLITITAGPEIARFDEFAVGDLVTASYVSSLSGELREPTETELAEPIIELDAAAIASEYLEPGAAVGRAIRAVCTIEGMNRAAGTVTLKDADGDFHVIRDVTPAKMDGVALGDTIIVTFTEAFALTLEKQAAVK